MGVKMEWVPIFDVTNTSLGDNRWATFPAINIHAVYTISLLRPGDFELFYDIQCKSYFPAKIAASPSIAEISHMGLELPFQVPLFFPSRTHINWLCTNSYQPISLQKAKGPDTIKLIEAKGHSLYRTWHEFQPLYHVTYGGIQWQLSQPFLFLRRRLLWILVLHVLLPIVFGV